MKLHFDHFEISLIIAVRECLKPENQTSIGDFTTFIIPLENIGITDGLLQALDLSVIMLNNGFAELSLMEWAFLYQMLSVFQHAILTVLQDDASLTIGYSTAFSRILEKISLAINEQIAYEKEN